ncbi:MAG TPA: hypothetical protein VN855_00160 [Candidatus Acidoferrum sp.]|nr:hypothetical protein [Candidatus Acidoferrum sp.]
MADLTYIQATLETKIVGQDATGNNANYVSADANGNLFVKDYSTGPVTPGAVASGSALIGGQFNTVLPTLTNTQQSAIQLDASGRLIIAPLSSATSSVSVSNFPTTVDTNFGTVGASTLRSAAQIGNATGAADFNAGATGAQTLRVSANGALAQASTTSGQTGSLAMGAVTTNPPAYVTAQTDPLSLNTEGGLRTIATTLNRTDQASAAQIATGNTATLSPGGYGCISCFINITAVSGTTPKMSLELQGSDDGSNWQLINSAGIATGTGNVFLIPTNIPYNNYRFAWIITGTNPSFTFSIVSTLKPFTVEDSKSQARINDLNLGTNGNTSSPFLAGPNPTVSLAINRTTGANSITYTIDVSNDGFTYFGWNGPNALTASPFTAVFTFTTGFKYWRLRVNVTVAGGGLCDVYWAAS